MKFSKSEDKLSETEVIGISHSKVQTLCEFFVCNIINNNQESGRN